MNILTLQVMAATPGLFINLAASLNLRTTASRDFVWTRSHVLGNLFPFCLPCSL